MDLWYHYHREVKVAGTFGALDVCVDHARDIIATVVPHRVSFLLAENQIVSI